MNLKTNYFVHLFVSFAVILSATSFSQNTASFSFTGGSQSWTVPACVNSITIVAEGGQGGFYAGDATGGNGAVVTSTITVNPGDNVTILVGGAGQCPGSGYNGGGIGYNTTSPPVNWGSCGGGGSTNISVNGTPVIIAAGGGGAGGGSVTNNVGGAGGCASGVAGGNTFGAGGGAGTQVAGGSGGTPWASTPPGGSPGSLGQGGQGGLWQTASGGGGGGGYYGGGGGGNDGCCTGANGGGGGGGGSSLVPAGAGCVVGGNTGAGSVTITYTGGIIPSVGNNGPVCEGGTLQLTAGGGTDYSWTGPNGFTSTDQNPTISNVTMAASGTYTVTIADPVNCPNPATVTTFVTINPLPTVNPVADQTLCNGDNTTAIAFTGNFGGTTYNWTNTNTAIGIGASGTNTVPSFVGTAVGIMQVGSFTVTPTLSGCVGTPETFTISVSPSTSLVVSNDTTICENGTATLVATASGGTSYLYHWDHTFDTQGTQQVNPAVNTTYSVYAENEFGCLSPTVSIDVAMFPPLTGGITPNDTICPGYPTDITAGVMGGIGAPYDFVWSSGETQSGNLTSQTISANPPVTQNYIVTITDGCESTPLVLQTNIRVAPLPVPQYQVLNPEQCEPAIFDIVNTTDPTMSQYVYWLVDGEYEYINQDTIISPTFMAGTYDIQMIVTSYEGCVDSLTFTDALEVQAKPIAYFNHSPNPVLMFNTSVFFTNNSFNGYSYQWYFEDGNPASSTQENVNVLFPDGETGSYEITLITTSELGCTDTMVYELIVFPEVLIYAPNTFTPDGDEFNQDWRVYMEGVDLANFHLLIYNRWGEIIWESNDIDVAWDGTYQGKIVPSDTYTWVLRTKDLLNDKKYTFNGHINVLK